MGYINEKTLPNMFFSQEIKVKATDRSYAASGYYLHPCLVVIICLCHAATNES